MKKTNRISGRRGQGAMEVILNYGWAVLIVMLVFTLLWRIGLVGSKGAIPTRFEHCLKIKPLLASVEYTTQGRFWGIFMNSAGSEIRNIRITFEDETTFDHTGIVSSGENFYVLIDGLPAGRPESKYKTTLIIAYDQNVMGEYISHSEYCTISGEYMPEDAARVDVAG